MAERQQSCHSEDQVVAQGVQRENEDLDGETLEEPGIAFVIGEHGADALTVHDQ